MFVPIDRPREKEEKRRDRQKGRQNFREVGKRN